MFKTEIEKVDNGYIVKFNPNLNPSTGGIYIAATVDEVLSIIKSEFEKSESETGRRVAIQTFNNLSPNSQ
jgi:hypothetical protein